MLDLCHSLPGQYERSTTSALLTLPRDGKLVLAYPSFDVINVLEAKSLRFLQSVGVEDVVARTDDHGCLVNCVASDQDLNLLFGSVGARVGVWAPSSSFRNRSLFRLHSTLICVSRVNFLVARKGVLAVAGHSEISVYKLNLEQDLPTWTLTYHFKLALCSGIQISPGLTRVSCISKGNRLVYIYSLENQRRLQSISHLRALRDMHWRSSSSSNPADLVLYTVTEDATIRVFMPVLDSPDHLQLHVSLDLHSFGVPQSIGIASRICWLDREAVATALNKYFELPIQGTTEQMEEESARRTRLRCIVDEGWDLFAVLTREGSVVVRAITNIDRRPPTLLHQFTTLHSPTQTLDVNAQIFSFHHEKSSSSTFLLTGPQLQAYTISPLSFFDAQVDGTRSTSIGHAGRGSSKPIQYFVRTASGLALGACYGTGGGEVWRRHPSQGIVRMGRWASGNISVIFNEGRMVASYETNDQKLTVYHLPSKSTQSLEISNVDSLIVLKDSHNRASIVAVTIDRSIVQISCVPPSPSSELRVNFLGPTTFPALATGGIPAFILPVDPMGWSFTPEEEQGTHDSVLSISPTGVLAFWSITSDGEWRATGQVHTQKSSIKFAKCSTAKKSALVTGAEDGKEELTIWDHKESEFSSGLECTRMFDEPIMDLDWTSTAAPQSQSILAIGFSQHVLLFCQQRLTYFDDEISWVEFGRVEIAHLTPYHISDSIWLAGGALLVGAGHQMFFYDIFEGTSPSSTQPDKQQSGNIFEIVASRNGALEDHHPQMLLQCLLWGKIELVKEIIVRLAASFDAAEAAGSESLYFTRLSPWQFLGGHSSYDSVVTWSSAPDDDDPNSFSRKLVERLLGKLEQQRLPHLSETEQAHLIVMIQTTLEIDEQRRALDANGLRYLISIRSFYTLNKRLESSDSIAGRDGSLGSRAGKRDRLRYRDIVWAFHSESQQIMMGASTEACGGRMTWADAKALGVFLWTRSSEELKNQMEVLARNQYLVSERDPVSCSLFYFALGKAKLVHGLWRQAAWHKDHAAMVKFLSNDFTEARWRTAALKNAFALLSKQRFEFAAAFFMLGGSLQDAVNVCLRQLNDFQLAIALARVVEGDSGPVLRGILTKVVVPLAFKEGNRWLGNWAFWMLGRRDLAVRILLTPLGQLAASLKDDYTIEEIGNPHFDDPSLALLFAQLKSKSLQTVKGVSEISGRTEFNFVLQMARVFRRMGCHPLALAITTSWSFDRPTLPTQGAVRRNSNVSTASEQSPASPTLSRRGEIQPRPRHHTRRQSLIMDMDISALPPTRTVSPVPEVPTPPPLVTVHKESGQKPEANETVQPRKTGLGSLMQAAKHEVKVPEFDMGLPSVPSGQPLDSNSINWTHSQYSFVSTRIGTFGRSTSWSLTGSPLLDSTPTPNPFNIGFVDRATTKTMEKLLWADHSLWRSTRVRVRCIDASESRSPITKLSGQAFLSAWLQCAQRHYLAWEAGIRHQDINPGNLLAQCMRGQYSGIVIDLNLSRVVGRSQETNEPTGDVPFMSVDLLRSEYWAGDMEALYRRDLESFIWILVWVVSSVRDGRERVPDLLKAWQTADYELCRKEENDLLWHLGQYRPLSGWKEEGRVALALLQGLFQDRIYRLREDVAFGESDDQALGRFLDRVEKALPVTYQQYLPVTAVIAADPVGEAE